MSWGPWSAGCKGHAERIAQLRTLQAITYLRLGPHHELVGVLKAAESDALAFVRAQALVDALPSLARRKILSIFSSITFRKPCP